MEALEVAARVVVGGAHREGPRVRGDGRVLVGEGLEEAAGVDERVGLPVQPRQGVGDELAGPLTIVAAASRDELLRRLERERRALGVGGGEALAERRGEGDVSGRYTPVVDLAYTSLIMNGIAGFTNDEIFLSGPVYLAMARVQDLTHTDISTNRIEVLQQTHAILVFDPMTVVAIESTATQPALTIGAPPQAN